jgi:hypothetical protein
MSLMGVKVMDKKTVLNEIRKLAQLRVITKEEISSAFDEGTISHEELETKQINFSSILYYAGAVVAFLGVSALIWQHWTSLTIGIKIATTLGAGIASYLLALFLSEKRHLQTMSSAFFLLAALLIPIGLHVVFDALGFNKQIYAGRAHLLDNIVFNANYFSQSVVSALTLGLFAFSYLTFRKTLFVIFIIFFTTWFFWSFSSFLFDSYVIAGAVSTYERWRIFSEIRIFCVGLVYMVLGYLLRHSIHRSLSEILYGVGAFCFLGSALYLGGWKSNTNMFWTLIFPILNASILYLSVYLRSKAMLVFGFLFLIAYIWKITGEYFAQSLGWAVALMIIGLALIVIGYAFITLKKRYFS